MLNAPRRSRDVEAQLDACLGRLTADPEEGFRDELLALACDRMRGIAHRMLRGFPSVRRWDDTDDVVQNALLRLHRALSKVTPRDARGFIGLAATQIRRELLDLARKHAGPESYAANHQTNVYRIAGTDFTVIDDAEDGRESPDRLARWTRLHEAAENLPDDEREIFELVWYLGLGQEVVGEIVGCSIRTVKRRWGTVKRLLTVALDGEMPH